MDHKLPSLFRTLHTTSNDIRGSSSKAQLKSQLISVSIFSNNAIFKGEVMCLMWDLGPVQPQNREVALDACELITATDSLSGDPLPERFTRLLWDTYFSVSRVCNQKLPDRMVNRNDMKVKIGKLELLVRNLCYRRSAVQPTHFIFSITSSVQETKLNWPL